jgi:hypothetical protein
MSRPLYCGWRLGPVLSRLVETHDEDIHMDKKLNLSQMRTLPRLPKQAEPVIRSNDGGHLANTDGVDPSWGWGDVFNIVRRGGGALLKEFG